MKTILQIALIAGTIGTLHAEEAAPASETTKNQEVATEDITPSKPKRRGVPKPSIAFEDLAGGAGYKPRKAVSESAGKGSQVLAATRGPEKSALKLVALAPENGGVTLSAQPRIWWWQSSPTAPGELEFTLSKVGNPSRTVYSVKIGARMKGYHAIDLSDERINPKDVSLDPGGKYMWSLGCDVPPAKAGDIATRNSVKVFLVRDSNEVLEGKLAEKPVSSEVVGELSESGNWYELFDLVAFSSGLQPDHAGLASLRDRLLEQIGLKNEAHP
jgi:hypothetical protein